MASITLKNIEKVFDKNKRVIDDFSLEIADGEFTVLVGPSGCGKSTLLRIIAGLETPTAGEILIDDMVINAVPPKDRNVAMVFQNYALYPHMTVFDNLGFGLKLRKMNKDEIRKRVEKAAQILEINDLLNRKPKQLSGGQRQRVALGRAIVRDPNVFLFDEPLSNLDARLRLSMRSEIKRLQRELGITSIYVTHDQVEAMTMADRIAVMKDGQLHAYDIPEEVYNRPRTLFIAQFIGNPPMNLFTVDVTKTNGTFHAQARGLDVIVSAARGEKAADKNRVTLGIRPEDIKIGEEGIVGEVYGVETFGRDHLVEVVVGDLHIFVLADPELGLTSGNNVLLEFNPGKVQFFDLSSEESLLWH
jgi:ABC-type sugar transport system ATPase subunit